MSQIIYKAQWKSYGCFGKNIYTQAHSKCCSVFSFHIQILFFFAGGCGAMYEVFIESEDFRGKNTLAQHRLVNKVRTINFCQFLISTGVIY